MDDFGVSPTAAGPAVLLLGMAAYLVAVAGASLGILVAGMQRAGFSEERRLRIGGARAPRLRRGFYSWP